MQIGGYQRLTMIDFPGKLATTIFTVGCSFRCPFCHNPELVNCSFAEAQRINQEAEFLEFLDNRRGKLEGVCITGGEPTIQPDIIDFIHKIRDMGFAVKLDTNGTRPDVVRKVIKDGLSDYFAMDIKHTQEKYPNASGLKTDIERIKLSIDLIRNSGVDYEFRTTVVPGIHEEGDFEEIAKWLSGAKKYYLQEYREEFKILDPTLKEKKKIAINFDKVRDQIKDYFEVVGIRR